MPDRITAEQVEKRLFCFIHSHRSTMHRYFQSIGMFNGHPHMLFHLRRHPGSTQKELAEVMDISPASVTISIKRLESAGLVRREKQGRQMHLYLTPAGEAMDTACAHGREFMIEHLYQGLTEAELTTLHALLEKMTDNLQRTCAAMDTAKEETP